MIAARLTGGANEVLLASRSGQAVRFSETQVRTTGRASAGVRGMRLGDDDEVVGMEILQPGATVLTLTQNGYGKRTSLDEYRVTARGGRGVLTIRTNERNGPVVGIVQVNDDDEVMLITDHGKVLRCPVRDISQMSRATQGVRVMKRGQGEVLAAVARLAENDAATPV